MERRFNAVLDRRGNAISSANVSIKDQSGNLATIFSDDGNTTATNPVVTNDDGEYTYFAANGKYTEEIIASGFASQTIDNTVLFDPTQLTAQAITDYGFVPVTEITTATYTIGTANFGCWLDVNTAGTATISLPDQTACVSFANGKGASVLIRQKGAGQVILAASGSATAVQASSLKTRAQYSAIGAQAVSTSVWTVFGDLA